jgi:hypothetical protein
MEARNAVVAGVRPTTGHDMRSALAFMLARCVKQTFICRDKDGNIKWVEEIENLTTNVGLADMVTQYWKGSAYTAAFFVGIKNTGAPASTDTMSSHAGWTENTGYSNANRPSLTLGSVTGTTTAAVDNSASLAVFNINASGTIFGAFIVTNNTKGGTTGTLVGVADFGASRAVLSGDTLSVQFNITQT